MRIVLISDSHGNYSALEKVWSRCSDADWLVHLGDGECDVDSFIMTHRDYESKIIHVAGNCDIYSLKPAFFVLEIAGHRIFLTHGHLYAVKNSLEIIKRTAKEYNCDIVCYGHTHVRYNRFEDGLYIMNPGSCSAPHDGLPPSFGSIDFPDEKSVVMNITNVSAPR